ncbi:MAG: hypothetical protein KAX20_07330 [Candidatus Omnitrophica bacterium]|nr:hypothetical protein [Candidatus Omnitrophota bacterium]
MPVAKIILVHLREEKIFWKNSAEYFGIKEEELREIEKEISKNGKEKNG